MKPEMTELFDRYLFNQMSEEEKNQFEQSLQNDSQLKEDFEQYKLLIQTFKDYHQRNELSNKFNEWYTETNITSLSSHSKTWWSVIYVAASVALVVTLSGIWFYETLKNETKKQGKEITYLKKEIKQIQSQQNNLVRSIQKIQTKNYAPANSQSTGFLMASNYVLTTYHSIQNADSIFIENDNFPRTEVKVVYTNNDLDVALLYAPSLSIKSPNIHLLKKTADIGNGIFTLGYPTSQLVYNEGYISSVNGYNNDTAFYQITLPLNPGNSGGPLFDNKGDIIGVIVSKNTSMEGVAFALKSNMLYALKDSLPADSIKLVWDKAFKSNSLNINKSAAIQKFKPYIFKVYVYQKSI
ncbi:MAG TPA: S1C family serine protease [Bacteroidia bacterium]|nr:S1C family serine protease [Bacteroidia bacterium]